MNEMVQSINVMLGVFLGGVSWSIYYIMRTAYLEMRDERQDDTRSES
jgi:hypothetical protein